MNRKIALLLCSLPLAASAQIYKWVDEKGEVHFSQNPPLQGNYEDVTPQSPASGTSTEGSSRATAKAASHSSSSGGDDRAAQQAMQARADNEERCAKARERVSFLQEKTAHRLFVTGDDGQPARMTNDQFDQELKDAQDAVNKYCE
jgi:hypothetical protein